MEQPKIIKIIGYRCLECGTIFDSKKEYVKAILHGQKENHTIKSIDSIETLSEINRNAPRLKENDGFEYNYDKVDI